MVNHYVISIDLGTTNAKAAIVDTDGALVATASASISLIQIEQDGVEQDPEVVWNVVKGLVQQVVRKADVGSSRISGIIVGGNYASLIGVDRHGDPTMNIIMHLDQRSVASNLKRYPEYRADRPWHQLKWIRRAGMPPLSSGVDTLSRMRFVKYAMPDVYSRTQTFLEPVDYLTLRFSGRATASQCTGSTMLGIDNNQHGQTEYDPDLIRMSGIDEAKWPELVPVNSVVGRIRADLAKELELSPDTKIFSGITDTQSSGVGAGAFTGTHAAIGIGTTGVMVTHTDRRRTDLLRGLLSMPAPVKDTYFVMGEGGLAGKVIEFYLTQLVYPNDGFADHSSDDTFSALDNVIATVPPGCNGLLFLPWLAGMFAPKSEPAMRGAMLNLQLSTTRAELARAAIEGVIFHLHWLRQSVEAFANRKLTHLVFYGGGARSVQVAQILADVSGIPVHRTADPQYVSTLGSAYLAFAQQGLISIADIPDKIKICEVLQPCPRANAIYNQRYREFRLAFKRTRPLFRRMNLF